ncbi:MAG: DUF47 domain-containing protein [Candidatus Hadarchaeota archaeon]
MSSEKPLSWFGAQEEKAFELCEQHMEKVVSVAKLMKKTIDSFGNNQDQLSENTNKVLKKEREADEIKNKVLKELSQGKFSTKGGESIIRFIMATDDIAENARAAVEKIAFLNPEDIDREIKEKLEKLSDFAQESVKLLRDAFLTLLHEDLEEAIIKTEKVEKMEEKVDHYRAETITPELIKWANNSTKTGNSIFLVEIENNIEEVVDKSEDSADTIREIALKNF